MNAKDATSRVASWALLLQQYYFNLTDVIYRPACQNGNVLQQSDPEINEIREKQHKDPASSAIMDCIQNDILPSNDAKARKILLRRVILQSRRFVVSSRF